MATPVTDMTTPVTYMATSVTDLLMEVWCAFASIIIGATRTPEKGISGRYVLDLKVKVVDSSGKVSCIEVHEWLRRHGITLANIGDKLEKN